MLVSPSHSLHSLSHGLEVGDALLERVVLLLGRDGLAHVGHDPVGHVLLLHAPHHVGQLQLVVETLLNLEQKEGVKYRWFTRLG